MTIPGLGTDTATGVVRDMNMAGFNVNDLYIGDDRIFRAYLGDTLVYDTVATENDPITYDILEDTRSKANLFLEGDQSWSYEQSNVNPWNSDVLGKLERWYWRLSDKTFTIQGLDNLGKDKMVDIQLGYWDSNPRRLVRGEVATARWLRKDVMRGIHTFEWVNRPLGPVPWNGLSPQLPGYRPYGLSNWGRDYIRMSFYKQPSTSDLLPVI